MRARWTWWRWRCSRSPGRSSAATSKAASGEGARAGTGWKGAGRRSSRTSAGTAPACRACPCCAWCGCSARRGWRCWRLLLEQALDEPAELAAPASERLEDLRELRHVELGRRLLLVGLGAVRAPGDLHLPGPLE